MYLHNGIYINGCTCIYIYCKCNPNLPNWLSILHIWAYETECWKKTVTKSHTFSDFEKYAFWLLLRVTNSYRDEMTCHVQNFNGKVFNVCAFLWFCQKRYISIQNEVPYVRGVSIAGFNLSNGNKSWNIVVCYSSLSNTHTCTIIYLVIKIGKKWAIFCIFM